ncbi:group III truncated hemoglobin [Siphonobacter sp. SORGH_AS_0500]|uniref:group III truncated hemoglobin n=2 Tax=unclassified Siphonobacter TaxID=2635712 RepID=UPI002781FF8F|nr:group III truncated hemoglobin [Siphonobacter sp. SORGH_AS_0500]MDQ1086329.1 hemoglobin [Siphonobacter sp. SORGH_AS_1065]MDR6196608.1 hemoglobin [Siphonobacter sp. SORGH_AS_0500]
MNPPSKKMYLDSSEAVRHLVDSFYEKVQKDELLAPIFTDVAQVDWAKHLPKMYGFWENLLLGNNSYHGHPFRPHLIINQKHTLTIEHFERWLTLFTETLAENFEGEGAENARQRATQIALVWNSKLEYLNNDSYMEN